MYITVTFVALTLFIAKSFSRLITSRSSLISFGSEDFFFFFGSFCSSPSFSERTTKKGQPHRLGVNLMNILTHRKLTYACEVDAPSFSSKTRAFHFIFVHLGVRQLFDKTFPCIIFPITSIYVKKWDRKYLLALELTVFAKSVYAHNGVALSTQAVSIAWDTSI